MTTTLTEINPADYLVAEGDIPALALVPIRRGEKRPYDPRTSAQRAEDDAEGWNPTWGATTRSPARWAAYQAQAEAQAHAEAATLALLRYRDGDNAAADADALAAELAELTAQAPVRGSSAYARLAELTRAVSREPVAPAERERMSALAVQADLPPLNVAVDVGLSRAIVIDADTTAEVEAFRAWAVRLSGDAAWADMPLTVSSPGVRASDGEWKHKGGGHCYLFLPPDYNTPAALPGLLTVHEGDGHFALFLRDRYVLLPPSARPEGEYRFTGPAHPAPRWLLAWLDAKAEATAQAKANATAYRQREGEGEGEASGLSDDLREQVEAWYSATPWSAILGQIGWTETGVDSSCGCPTWGRPGGASPKSATAHEPGCSRHPDSVDPPIHFWTTEPGDAIEDKIAETASQSRSLSKLQLAAALFCDGSDAAALEQIVGEPLSAPPMVQTFIEVSPGFTVAGPRRPTAEGESAGVVVVTAEEWARMNNAVAPALAPAPAAAPANALATAPTVAPAAAPANANANAPAETAQTATAAAPAQVTLAIDIETFSSCDLAKSGVYRYAEADDFCVLLFSYAWGDDPVEVVDLTTGALPDDVLAALTDPTVIKSAFNAAFERVCLSRYLRDLGELAEGEFLDPAEWHCTQVHAGVGCLPAGLGPAAAAVGVVEKMSEGKSLIRRFSVPNKPRKSDDTTRAIDLGEGKVRWLPASDPEGWNTFKEYCKRDVQVEMELRNRLTETVPTPAQLWEEYAADQRINDRGFRIDLDLAKAAMGVDQETRDAALDRLREITGVDNPRSTTQIRAWLAERGLPSEKTDKEAMVALHARAEAEGDAAVAEVAALLPKVKASSASKFETMLRNASADGRARGQLVFHGTHTGRWAGRKIQPQNMAATPNIPDLDAARDAVFRGPDALHAAGLDPRAIGQMARTAVIPAEGYQLAAIDYAQIEARVIAWLAGEARTLTAFARGADIYCSTASAMYGVPVTKTNENSHLRKLGKIAVLGCGFGAGPGGLSKANPTVPMEDLRTAVRAWRAANPAVVTMWREVEAAVRNVLFGGLDSAEGYRVRLRSAPSLDTHGGKDLLIDLPSGRQLRYLALADEPIRKGPRAGEKALHMTVRGVRKSTWGGDLVQSIVQATARDIITAAMVAAEAAGARIVLHVHDEVVAEVKSVAEAEALAELMGRAPAWAQGLPLSAEPVVMDYYRKA